MKKQVKLFFMSFILGIIMLSLVSSWMPETHTMMNDQALLQTQNEEISKVVQRNYEDFIACDVLSDISVFYYFSEGFNSIGKTYKQTHSINLCDRLVKTASNERQLACAYGVCSHLMQDQVSHNKFIPSVITRTKLVNGIVHALAEEDVNDNLITKELQSKIKQALVDVAPYHKEFFRNALVSDNADFPFDSMYDAFVDQVTQNNKYSVGFQGFTAIPTEIHVVFILLFILSLVLLAYLIKKENKRVINYISMFLVLFIILFVIMLYVLFYTGKLWLAFQTLSTPLTAILPTQGWQSYVTEATQNTVGLLRGGIAYAKTSGLDPVGENALAVAGQVGAGLRIIVDIILVAMIGLLVWLNVRKKK